MSVDDVFFWANWTLVGALVIGVAATYAIVVSGSIRDANLKRELSSSSERTVGLEKEAADAQLETERLKQVVAWRSIPPGNASELGKVLVAKPGSVNLRYTDGRRPRSVIFSDPVFTNSLQSQLEDWDGSAQVPQRHTVWDCHS